MAQMKYMENINLQRQKADEWFPWAQIDSR